MANLAGRTLKGRYRIEESIGRGGMAEVYRAFDTRRGYAVALKVLREDLAEDWEFVRRFQAQADSLARLAHQNIVRFYSFEQDDSLALIVMDFVEGDTLRRHLFHRQGQPMSPAEVLPVARQVAAALEFAHGEGIIHRDVKPGNIMLRPDGTALLSDFGIAKAADAATVTTMAPGTPAYMSPEQCRGDRLDARSDVYSLGVVLYEMLAGRRPFVGEEAPDTVTGGTLERVRWEQLHAEPPDPQQFNPALTEGVVLVLRRTLAKNPNERYPSAAALYRAFEGSCRGARAGQDQPPEPRQTMHGLELIGPPPDQPAARVQVGSVTARPTIRRPIFVTLSIAGVALTLFLGAFLSGQLLQRRMTTSAPPAPPLPSPTSSLAAAQSALPTAIPSQQATVGSPAALGAAPTSRVVVPTSPALTTTLQPSATPQPKASDTPAATPTPYVQVGDITLNLRAGPGTNFPVVGQPGRGQAYAVVARNADGSWLRLAGTEERWVAAGLVTRESSPQDLPVAPRIPVPPTNPPTTLPPTVARPADVSPPGMRYPAPVLTSPGNWARYSKDDEIQFAIQPLALPANAAYKVDFYYVPASAGRPKVHRCTVLLREPQLIKPNTVVDWDLGCGYPNRIRPEWPAAYEWHVTIVQVVDGQAGPALSPESISSFLYGVS